MAAPIKTAALCLVVLWLALVARQFSVLSCYDGDSGNFARGVLDYNVQAHRPHPPGYPLFVLLAKGPTALGVDPMLSLALVAFAFTAASLLLFYPLARECMDAPAAAATTCLLAFSPMVSLCAAIPLTYSADLFASCVAGWMASRIWKGQAGYIVPACAALALLAGVRQSGATFLLPLLAVAILRRIREFWPKALAGGALGALLCTAWYVPMVALSGGRAMYDYVSGENAFGAFRKTSFLFGASLERHIFMVVENCIYLFAALAPLALVALAGRGWRNTQRPAWFTPLFFVAWMLPNVVETFLIHAPKPGYQMLVLPPLALLLGCGLNGLAVKRVLAVLGAGAAISLVMAYAPYRYSAVPPWATPRFFYARSTPRMAYLVREARDQLRDALRSLPPGTVVGCLTDRPEAPSWGSVRWDYPEYRWVLPGEEAKAWVCLPGVVPPEVRARGREVWRSDLGALWVEEVKPGTVRPVQPATGR